jgi:hypothetical protein
MDGPTLNGCIPEPGHDRIPDYVTGGNMCFEFCSYVPPQRSAERAPAPPDFLPSTLRMFAERVIPLLNVTGAPLDALLACPSSGTPSFLWVGTLAIISKDSIPSAQAARL